MLTNWRRMAAAVALNVACGPLEIERTDEFMATPFAQRSIRISLFALAIVVLLWLGLAQAKPAQAATSYVVTNCTAQGLVDAMNTFNNTLVQDGIISFNCNN